MSTDPRTTTELIAELRKLIQEIVDSLGVLEQRMGIPPARTRASLTVVEGRQWRRATPRREGHLRSVK